MANPFSVERLRNLGSSLRTSAAPRLRSAWEWIRASARNAVITALAVALVGGVVPVLLTHLLTPTEPECPGAGCDGKSPQTHGCAADAVTFEPQQDNPVRLHLRYSKHCGVVWARVLQAKAGDAVTQRVDGGSAQSAVVEYGQDRFTDMSVVEESFSVNACAVPSTQESRTWDKYCIKATDKSAWSE
ncbi:DUF2690 domain-containing protein [Streptomyces luteolus]|uniref:DUF2690 domain-containing protein n=1 Tax=Streptomyces luteolus TaxID=3043615 RepID=A0ABT6T1K6_9ACTN|nr:DUF2690 domain-containing protein [Streptomyces sp. B-S-A12]MDI3421744.1 DUF2690 domain-containing protein [Streptomyces sp. B-S-A12]